ncbi:hypothetical protein IA54_019610 [Xanthomonas phaseoli pv. syngonii LMG 9055]|uniref:Uncharacterized protein n=1 Tax=Xanthomonas phaseoli pv. syngonii LMG 9055 TaxID=1437878 RepID=A0A1V9HJZ5_9XANT|nr:hypothetical protein IA54_019610 [Xanthomonas phaseoli pv. syngonii LMG 9055]
MRFISPFERCLQRSGNLAAIGITHIALQALLHILMQSLVSRQFRWFGPFSKVLCLPLCDRSSIFKATTTGGCVTRKLERNGRWATTDATSNFTYPNILGREQPDLFTLGE